MIAPLSLASLPHAVDALRTRGFAVLGTDAWRLAFGVTASELSTLASSWHQLAPDRYLKDGGRYRSRRHACYRVHGALGVIAEHQEASVAVQQVEDQPHRPHWQPVAYNALHGGIERWFEPVQAEVSNHRAWRRILAGLGDVATALRGHASADGPWAVEAHQFRIDTTDGIGRPTPEGAHRDGVDLVAVFMVARHSIKGGETRVFDADGPHGERFTLVEPWSLLLLDDAKVIHESTPIQPVAEAARGESWRDTLVVTYRAGAFQGPEV